MTSTKGWLPGPQIYNSSNQDLQIIQERVYGLEEPLDLHREGFNEVTTATPTDGRREKLAQIEILVLATILFFAVLGNSVVLVSSI